METMRQTVIEVLSLQFLCYASVTGQPDTQLMSLHTHKYQQEGITLMTY